MIYLATPYSHPSAAVMEARFVAACHVAGALMARGEVVFCPIAHSHPIQTRCPLPGDLKFWVRQDFAHMAYCDKVLVVKMPGWEESKGVAAEIARALRLGIPVEYMEYLPALF